MNIGKDKCMNVGVAPVTYGQGDRPPRGDYSRARADYSCEQDFARYTEADHDTYRRLHARQLEQLPGLACQEFIDAVEQLGAPERIPRFDDISRRLDRATGWRIVGVPGLIPEEAFFALLARLYWYTVEFGLIDTPQGVRAYGSGILSSAGELRYAVTDPQPQRLAFRLERLMRTEYKIDTYQANYFVIDSFSQLFQATAPDFTPIYTAVRRLPPIAPGIRLPGERNYPAGAAKSGGVRA